MALQFSPNPYHQEMLSSMHSRSEGTKFSCLCRFISRIKPDTNFHRWSELLTRQFSALVLKPIHCRSYSNLLRAMSFPNSDDGIYFESDSRLDSSLRPPNSNLAMRTIKPRNLSNSPAVVKLHFILTKFRFVAGTILTRCSCGNVNIKKSNGVMSLMISLGNVCCCVGLINFHFCC